MRHVTFRRKRFQYATAQPPIKTFGWRKALHAILTRWYFVSSYFKTALYAVTLRYGGVQDDKDIDGTAITIPDKAATAILTAHTRRRARYGLPDMIRRLRHTSYLRYAKSALFTAVLPSPAYIHFYVILPPPPATCLFTQILPASACGFAAVLSSQ